MEMSFFFFFYQSRTHILTTFQSVKLYFFWTGRKKKGKEKEQMEMERDFMAANQIFVRVFKGWIWVNSVFIDSAPVRLLLPADKNQRWGRGVGGVTKERKKEAERGSLSKSI